MSSSPNESSITPQVKSTFEHVVRQLHLSPEEYATSAVLKEWVRQNKDQKYVPPYLLDLWGFEVDVKLFDDIKKPKARRIRRYSGSPSSPEAVSESLAPPGLTLL